MASIGTKPRISGSWLGRSICQPADQALFASPNLHALESEAVPAHNRKLFKLSFERLASGFPMKKLLLTICAVLALAGCSTKEKTGLKEVLIEKFKDDQDLKDYKLDPAVVAECVVGEISGALPGFAGDPRRAQFFEAYTRFISVKSPGDAEKAITDYQGLFGSAKKAREAANSVTDHVMTCMGKAIDSTGGNREGG
ncbi:hypothetical protein [Methylomagnum sp.]